LLGGGTGRGLRRIAGRGGGGRVPGVPESSSHGSLQALAAYVGERELLLVLDNCERLTTECAALLDVLMPQAPGLRVLATSQGVLGLPGEAVYRLAPLIVPGPSATAETAEVSPAVALFADRAAHALNGFKLTAENVGSVVELCRRLDGMPLAIELAAAHARLLSPAQVLERIGDRFALLASRSSTVPARQQSLGAALDWSYDNCSEAERLLWCRLSTFPGSFDLSAAEAVCAGARVPNVAATAGQLVDRSVLTSEPHASGMRYRMLETIREYGRRKLRESSGTDDALSEEQLRVRHLDWYAEQTAEFERSWFGPGQREWLDRLRLELPNIRAALSFAADRPASTERGLMLAGDLSWFWRASAIREGEQWLARLLRSTAGPSAGRARSLVAVALLLSARGQQEANQVAEEALATAEEFDSTLVPRARAIRAISMAGQGSEETTEVLQTALSDAQRSGSVSDRILAMHSIAWSLGLAGHVAEAEKYYAASVALSEEFGELSWRGAIQLRHALVAWTQGDLPLMTAAATDALRAARLVDDRFTSANAVCLITAAAVVGRRDRLAARLFGAAERFWEDAGGSIVATPPWQRLLEDAKDRCRAATGAAVFDEHYQHGRQEPFEDAVAEALGERPPRAEIPLARLDFGLTRRELEVVDLISHGLTNKEIAQGLVISVRTADTHVQNVLTKTGFNTRSQVAAWHAAHAQAAH